MLPMILCAIFTCCLARNSAVLLLGSVPLNVEEAKRDTSRRIETGCVTCLRVCPSWGALRVCPKVFPGLVPSDIFRKGLVESAVDQGAAEAKHAIAVFLQPPCAGSFQAGMADKLVG